MTSPHSDTYSNETTLRVAVADLGTLLESWPNIFNPPSVEGGPLKAVEHVLEKHQSLKLQSECVLELIYVEFMARRESAVKNGLDADEISSDLFEEFRERFPEIEDELEKLFHVDRAFVAIHSDVSAMISGRKVSDNDAGTFLGRIGDFRLIEEIGRGGMGVVYRAIQESLGREVALKTLEGFRAFDRVEIERLRMEAELASKLQHPNIVQIFEVGTLDEVPFFSMELIAGGNLAEAVGKQPLHPDICARLVAVIARAVGYAHSQGVVHRDLKPSNILLLPSSRPEAIALFEHRHSLASNRNRTSDAFETKVELKVGDFGLATGITPLHMAESQPLAAGTPSYMAPEQLENPGETGPACDIYSLGAILYELLGGRPPFIAATLQETLDLVRNEEPISLRQMQPRLARDLETICYKCLRKDPLLRYDSAEALADDLTRFVQRLPIQARPASALERGIKWVRRHPAASALMSSIALALVMITWLWQTSEENRQSEKLARQRGEQLIYAGKIALAKHEFNSQDIERCRALLDECDPKFRNWEWNYLKNLTHEPIWESNSSSQSVNATALSRDGNRVAIGHGAWNVNQKQSIDVWDIPNNKRLWQLNGHPPSEICDVRFSPDGKLLVSAAVVWGKPSSRGNVIVWDLETGIAKHIIEDTNARVARITPNGDSIIVGSTDGTVSQFQLPSGEKICVSKKHDQMVFDLAFGPNGQLITCGRDGRICVWNSHLELSARAEGMGDTRNIAWSPDGRELRVYNYGGLARKFSIRDGQFRLEDSEDTSEFRFERFSPDGQYVATAEFGLGVRLRRSRDGGVFRILQGHRGHVRSLSFDGPGTRLATGGSDGSVRVWDISTPELNAYKGVSKSATVTDLAFHPTSPEIAVAMIRTHSRPESFSGLPRLEIWDSRTFAIKRTFPGHRDWLTCVKMNDTGTRLISGSHDQSVRIWNSSEGENTIVFEEHSASILDACFVGSENAASIDATGVFLLWNQETGGIQKRAAVFDAPVKLAELLPAHGLVAAVSQDNRLVIWDWNHEKTLLEKTLPFAIRAICISFNRNWIAVAGESPKTLLWDFDRFILSPNAPPNLELDGHADLVTSLCFSPDSQRLISTGNDETVRMFELSLGREVLKLEGLKGLENLVAMSPDGAQLMRFSQRNFRVWNAKRQQEVETRSPIALAGWHHRQALAALQQRNSFATLFHSGRAVELDSENTKFGDTRVLGLIYSEQWPDAEIAIRNIIHTAPSGQRQCMLGRILIAQGKTVEYRQQCRVLSDMIRSKEDPAIVNGAAWICSLCPDSGTDFARWIERLDPIAKAKKSPYYWNTLALLHYRAEHYPESIRCANESMKLGIEVSAPYDWIVKALCYVEQERRVATETDPKTKRQSVVRINALQSQIAKLLQWFDRERTRINLGLESKALEGKDRSFTIPLLLGELNAKMTSAGIGIDSEARLQSMLMSLQSPETMPVGRP